MKLINPLPKFTMRGFIKNDFRESSGEVGTAKQFQPKGPDLQW